MTKYIRHLAVISAFSVASLVSQAADALGAIPSGPQEDGHFRKVILDTDRDMNGDGVLEDSLKDPMELAVAKDGRVFYAERDGYVKMWSPQTKTNIVIAKLKVFTG